MLLANKECSFAAIDFDPLFANTSKTAKPYQVRSAMMVLNEPKYLSATLIFLRSKGIAFPKRFQDLLGAKTTFFHSGLAGILLQGLLFQGSPLVQSTRRIQQLFHELKQLA